MTSSDGWFQSAEFATFDSARKTLPAWAPRQPPLMNLSQAGTAKPKLPLSESTPEVTQNPGIVFSLHPGISC